MFSVFSNSGCRYIFLFLKYLYFFIVSIFWNESTFQILTVYLNKTLWTLVYTLMCDECLLWQCLFSYMSMIHSLLPVHRPIFWSNERALIWETLFRAVKSRLSSTKYSLWHVYDRVIFKVWTYEMILLIFLSSSFCVDLHPGVHVKWSEVHFMSCQHGIH